MAQSKSSKDWLKRHFDDPFVKKAQKEGHRSRAVFKLMEIQEKYKLVQPGMNVVDLGAAPGGWSEIAVKLLKGKGKLFALDILEMDPIQDVHFIQGDFREESVMNELLTALNGEPIDLVLSDMAPNMSGHKHIDQPRAMYLVELAFEFAEEVLTDKGAFLVKIFHGEGFDVFLQTMKKRFKQVVVRKPEASRDKSKEVYILGKGRK
jgi:23S rRNA (uridine2552-2'-O)-methyltransferase